MIQNCKKHCYGENQQRYSVQDQILYGCCRGCASSAAGEAAYRWPAAEITISATLCILGCLLRIARGILTSSAQLRGIESAWRFVTELGCVKSIRHFAVELGWVEIRGWCISRLGEPIRRSLRFGSILCRIRRI